MLTRAEERGLFVFGDLNVKHPGTYRLKFCLYEIRRMDGKQVGPLSLEIPANGSSDCCEQLASVTSRTFGGLSTFVTYD